MQRTVDSDFPKVQLCLGLQMHRCARLLRAERTFTATVETCDRSILAGCTLSMSLASSYLRPIVTVVENTSTHAVGEHVDDFSSKQKQQCGKRCKDDAIGPGRGHKRWQF